MLVSSTILQVAAAARQGYIQVKGKTYIPAKSKATPIACSPPPTWYSAISARSSVSLAATEPPDLPLDLSSDRLPLLHHNKPMLGSLPATKVVCGPLLVVLTLLTSADIAVVCFSSCMSKDALRLYETACLRASFERISFRS